MAHPGRPALSVIVVTHDEREVVERCLPPLQAQLEDGDELIVADNRSTDGTADAVRRIAPSAQVIEMPSNDGYMAAANAALARATGDLLLTLDADAIVAPGFCDAIRRPAVDALDMDPSLFQRLAQRIERIGAKLGKLVEEQDAAMRE